jgi:flagellum-specific ATP synthase
MQVDLGRYLTVARAAARPQEEGRVLQIVGLIVEGFAPGAAVGSLYEILPSGGGPAVRAEVVGFREQRALMMPIGELHGVGTGSPLRPAPGGPQVQVGESLLGRVIDGLGRPLDGKPAPECDATRPLYATALPPLARRPIAERLALGIRSVDALLTCGRGQRVGVFAGSGIGKSVLLGMMARNTEADVRVIALVGERGWEVGDFLDRVLGEEGLRRSVVVVSTSDRSPLERTRAAYAAHSIAEYFRDRGTEVLLVMDSLTRFAMAQREIGLSIGEPPATKGYTPSVFATMPRLLERVAPRRGGGSITGLYTVLVEGDDVIAGAIGDAARAILDGHIVLSRAIAARGLYPAIDVVGSASRVMPQCVPARQVELATRVREVLATCREAEDLINIGAYVAGRNSRLDAALAKLPEIEAFLRQAQDERVGFDEAIGALERLAAVEARPSVADPRSAEVSA